MVAGSRDRRATVEAVARETRGDCVLVGDAPVRGSGCRVEASPARYARVLGEEAGAAVVSVEGLLRPSLVAAAGETVRAGGALVIAGPPWGEWSVGPRGGRGLYKLYLEQRIREARLHSWWEPSGPVSRRLDCPRLEEPPRPRPRPGSGVPRALQGLARTRSQLRAVEEILSFLRGGGRSLLVRGDRGRGKSFSIGLGLAAGVKFKLVGRASVVGPSPWQVGQVFRGLLAGLEALGVPHRVRRRGDGAVLRVSGPWYSVSYEPPWSATMAPLAVVDEAASVGVARLRRITWRSPKTIVSTTVHGYEGSGRVFAWMIRRVLPRPLREVELVEPIRYLPGDPLEEWLYRAFLLRAEPPEPRGPVEPGSAVHRVHPPERLARDHALLEALWGVLAQAHYRTTPDGLLLLLEAGHHEVHALHAPTGEPVAVLELAYEYLSGEEAGRLATERLLLAAAPGWSGDPRVARVSRIAVVPRLQRRGLGSRLLRAAEERARERGALVAAALFSRHDAAPFWHRNGYLPYYVSPRYNRVTGEKNLAYARSLHPGTGGLVGEAHCSMRNRLLLAAQSTYRDLPAETLLLLLEPEAPRCEPQVPPPRGNAAWRLRRFLEGGLGLEQARDAAWQCLAHLLAGGPGPLRGLGPRERVLLASFLLQGKPLNEAARAAGVGEDEALRLLEEGSRAALRGCPRTR